MTPTRRTTLLAVIILAVAAVCFFVAQIHSRLSRSQHNPERSYIVHSAAMMDYDTGSQLNAFRYALSYEDIKKNDCANLGLECRIHLVNRDGKQLQRWGNSAPAPAGTAGTITIRASLKDGKIQCQVSVIPNIPGIQTKLTASPKKWEGGLSSSLSGMSIIEQQHLFGPEPRKALYLMQYDDNNGHTLRITMRFVYRDRGQGAIPPE